MYTRRFTLLLWLHVKELALATSGIFQIFYSCFVSLTHYYRTPSSKITWRPLVHFLLHSFLAVTKQLFWSPLVICVIGLYTSLLGTSTIMFVEGIVMVLFCLAFWPYKKVSIVVLNYVLCFAYFCHLADNESHNDVKYCRFWHQLLYTLLQKILKPIRLYMTTPKVVQCPDGHYHQAIFSLGPYITDYPEQCLLSSIVQGWCPWYVYDSTTVFKLHLSYLF